MKKSLNRIVALLLVAVMMLGVLASCTPGANPGDTTSPQPPVTTDPPTVDNTFKTDPAAAQLTKVEDLANYVIVHSELASDEVERLADALAEAIFEATELDLPIETDLVDFGDVVPTDTKEILLGTTNRPESIANLKVNDYTIVKKGNRIVISAGSDAALAAAVDEIKKEMLSAEAAAFNAPMLEYIFRDSYKFTNLSLGGVSIGEYVIVRDAEDKEVASYLQKVIAEACGLVLPIHTAREHVVPYEILIGDIAREGLETAYPADGTYTVKQVGTKLLLGGQGNLSGYFALLDFLNTYMDKAPAAETLALTVTAKEGEHLKKGLYKLNLDNTILPTAGKVPDLMSAEAVMEQFLLAKDQLPEEVTVVERLKLDDYKISQSREIFVDPNGGNDANPGTKEKPVKTIKKATDLIGGMNGGVIWLRGGTYSLTDTLTIDSTHSGTAASPLFIKAYEKENPVLTANLVIDSSGFVPVDPGDDVAARLPEDAKEHVMSVNLKDLGWTDEDIGNVLQNVGPTTLYVDGELYTTARYPNDTGDIDDLMFFTYVYDTGSVSTRDGSDLYFQWQERVNSDSSLTMASKIGWQICIADKRDYDGVADPKDHENKYDEDGKVLGKVNMPFDKNEAMEDAEMHAEEILNWVNTGNIWYYGSLFEGWEFGYYNIDPACVHDGDKLGKSMQNGYYSLKSIDDHPNNYGAKHSTNSPAGRNTFYLFNAIEALDVPGEWFIDIDTGILYVYPQEGVDLTASKVTYSGSYENRSFSLVNISGAEYVVWDGVDIDGSNKYGLYISQSSNVVIQNSTFKNTMAANLAISKSYDTAVIWCDFSECGTTAMLAVSCGDDLQNLKPCNVVVQNNRFHDPRPTRQTAITISGVQVVVSHNELHDTNITGGTATECIVEYNQINGGSQDIADGGLIYFGGATVRANHYRYNLLHTFNSVHCGIYNDTMGSGCYAYGNMIVTVGGQSDSFRGWYSSTGHGNVCYGNIIVLRNKGQVDEFVANGGVVGGGDDYENTSKAGGDNITQSGLFYYYYGNDAYPNRNKENQYNSLAGHWWNGLKTAEVKRYFTTYDKELWKQRNPAYMNYLEGIQLILAALADTTKPVEERYEVFYPVKKVAPGSSSDPAYNSNDPKSAGWVSTDYGNLEFTYACEDGITIQVPESYYYDENDEKHIIQAKTVTAQDGNGITLTYYEIAAMERLARQPAFCVISNNILLGGSDNKSLVITNSAANYCGTIKNTENISNNFFEFSYQSVMPYFDPVSETYLYDINEEAWAEIAEFFGENEGSDLKILEKVAGLATSKAWKVGVRY